MTTENFKKYQDEVLKLCIQLDRYEISILMFNEGIQKLRKRYNIPNPEIDQREW